MVGGTAAADQGGGTFWHEVTGVTWPQGGSPGNQGPPKAPQPQKSKRPQDYFLHNTLHVHPWQWFRAELEFGEGLPAPTQWGDGTSCVLLPGSEDA